MKPSAFFGVAVAFFSPGEALFGDEPALDSSAVEIRRDAGLAQAPRAKVRFATWNLLYADSYREGEDKSHQAKKKARQTKQKSSASGAEEAGPNPKVRINVCHLAGACCEAAARLILPNEAEARGRKEKSTLKALAVMQKILKSKDVRKNDLQQHVLQTAWVKEPLKECGTKRVENGLKQGLLDPQEDEAAQPAHNSFLDVLSHHDFKQRKPKIENVIADLFSERPDTVLCLQEDSGWYQELFAKDAYAMRYWVVAAHRNDNPRNMGVTCLLGKTSWDAPADVKKCNVPPSSADTEKTFPEDEFMDSNCFIHNGGLLFRAKHLASGVDMAFGTLHLKSVGGEQAQTVRMQQIEGYLKAARAFVKEEDTTTLPLIFGGDLNTVLTENPTDQVNWPITEALLGVSVSSAGNRGLEAAAVAAGSSQQEAQGGSAVVQGKVRQLDSRAQASGAPSTVAAGFSGKIDHVFGLDSAQLRLAESGSGFIGPLPPGFSLAPVASLKERGVEEGEEEGPEDAAQRFAGLPSAEWPSDHRLAYADVDIWSQTGE